MQKIDRLGWAAGVSVTCYGLRIGIRVTDATLLPRLSERFPPASRLSAKPVVAHLFSFIAGGSMPGSRVQRFHLVYNGAERIARTRDIDEALDAFESALRLLVAERARGHVFVHAGVVGWQGRAILIPGRSFSGKTSLVAALVKAGALYYSDEYAVLDPDGRVHPYSAPLSIRNPGESRQRRVTVESLGGRVGAGGLQVGLVALTRFKEGARWRPRRVTPGRGALEMLSNTVPAQRNPALALTTLQRVVSRSPVLRGVRGEAGETAASLIAAMEMDT